MTIREFNNKTGLDLNQITLGQVALIVADVRNLIHKTKKSLYASHTKESELHQDKQENPIEGVDSSNSEENSNIDNAANNPPVDASPALNRIPGNKIESKPSSALYKMRAVAVKFYNSLPKEVKNLIDYIKTSRTSLNIVMDAISYGLMAIGATTLGPTVLSAVGCTLITAGFLYVLDDFACWTKGHNSLHGDFFGQWEVYSQKLNPIFKHTADAITGATQVAAGMIINLTGWLTRNSEKTDRGFEEFNEGLDRLIGSTSNAIMESLRQSIVVPLDWLGDRMISGAIRSGKIVKRSIDDRDREFVLITDQNGEIVKTSQQDYFRPKLQPWQGIPDPFRNTTEKDQQVIRKPTLDPPGKRNTESSTNNKHYPKAKPQHEPRHREAYGRDHPQAQGVIRKKPEPNLEPEGEDKTSDASRPSNVYENAGLTPGSVIRNKWATGNGRSGITPPPPPASSPPPPGASVPPSNQAAMGDRAEEETSQANDEVYEMITRELASDAPVYC